jgi:hypothetical protein
MLLTSRSRGVPLRCCCNFTDWVGTACSEYYFGKSFNGLVNRGELCSVVENNSGDFSQREVRRLRMSERYRAI